MRPRGRKHRRTADAAAASGSAATWTPPRDEHPAVRTASPGGRRSATTADTPAVSAGGGVPCGGHPGLDTRWGGGSAAAADPHAAACAHCRRRRACMDGRLPAAAMSPPCSGGCGRVRGGQRPSSQHPAALPDAPHTPPRCPVPWTPAGVPGQVGAAGGHRRSGRVDSRRGLWTPAGGRCAADTRDGGRVVRTYGNGTLDCQRQSHPPPPPMSDQERDRNVRHRPAPPWRDRQIRSLAAAGKLASSWLGSAAQESRPLR